MALTIDEMGAIQVRLPSGGSYAVQTDDEADFVNDLVASYMETFIFPNPTDVADLDAIVRKELLVWRWETWLSLEKNWDGLPIDIRHYSQAVKQLSVEVRQLKDQLQIDKKTRDRTTGDGSVPEFINRITVAAKELGIHRSEQLDRGLELCMQLRALATVWKNSDDAERRMTRCTSDDIVQWINEVFDPEMQAVATHFETHPKRTWVGEL